MILIFHLSSSLDPASDAFGQVLGSMHCCTASPSQWFPSPAPSLCRSAGRAGPGFSSFLQLPSANAQHVTFLWSWKRQDGFFISFSEDIYYIFTCYSYHNILHMDTLIIRKLISDQVVVSHRNIQDENENQPPHTELKIKSIQCGWFSFSPC